ncbi:MAG: CPBP family intramembrane metalloprotease [Chloroflexi bacterium]|nr:CPBP family intramembrane metalloprotease [Chloroflexota bacterium]
MATARSEKQVFWLEAAILWLAGMVGVLAVIPYSLHVTATDLTISPIPAWQLLLLSVVQNGVLLAVAVMAGLWFARQVGLEVPVLEAWLRGQPLPRRRGDLWRWAVPLGVGSAVLIILLDVLVFAQSLVAGGIDAGTAQPPAWKGLLASFYGGISEELFLRLFFLSALAWLLGRVWKSPDGRPTAAAMWTAIVAAAVLFGLGHLPATAALVPLTPMVVLRAVVLNGVLGVAAGWLYWRKGLEMAIAAHFSADIVLHVLLPLLG